MEPNTSMQAATALLGVGAAGGAAMAFIRFTGAPRPPSWLALLHGVLAAAGLTLLAYAALTVGLPPMALFALGLLVVAALGGAVINLKFHANQLPLPIPLIVGHALLAVAGFVLLLFSVLNLPRAG